METPLHKLVAAKVGQYDGAYSTLKVAPEMMPARLPRPTRNPVRAALDDSERSLLLCLEYGQQCPEPALVLVDLTMSGPALMGCKHPMP